MMLFQASELYLSPFSDIRIEMYCKILEDYPIDKIGNAMMLHYKDEKKGSKLPLPSDIVAKINVIREEERALARIR